MEILLVDDNILRDTHYFMCEKMIIGSYDTKVDRESKGPTYYVESAFLMLSTHKKDFLRLYARNAI